MRTAKRAKTDPRPGVIVCVARADGYIVLYGPGAYMSREWRRYAEEARRREMQEDKAHEGMDAEGV